MRSCFCKLFIAADRLFIRFADDRWLFLFIVIGVVVLGVTIIVVGVSRRHGVVHDRLLRLGSLIGSKLVSEI
jgi:hypothetical protein